MECRLERASPTGRRSRRAPRAIRPLLFLGQESWCALRFPLCGGRGVCARAYARTRDMDDAPTPPTVRKRVVARSTREGSSSALASGPSPFQKAALPPPPVLSLPPPFRDPSSTPGLDRLRHQLIDELAGCFPLTLDAREYSVVLVCGDWEDSAQDWAALVLDVEGCRPGSAGTSREGLLFVKPLEMIPPDAREPDDRDRNPRGGRKRPRRPTADPHARTLVDPDARTLDEDERPPVRLRLAPRHPAQLLDAAAVMDRLRFAADNLPERTLALPDPENPPHTRRGCGSEGPVGAAPDRGLPGERYDDAREPLRRRYAFSPGPALRRELAVDGAPFPSSRGPWAPRDAFLPSPQAPVFRDNPAFEAGAGAGESRSGSRSEDEEVETWTGTSALRPRPGSRVHAPSPVPFPPPARDGSPERSLALDDVPEEEEEEEAEEEEEEEEEKDDDSTLSEDVGKGAAAALRRALESAKAGAVVLTLPVEDVEMVLAELENLRRRLMGRTRR
jgi:hypothetical protein